jgi:DHA1 family bicyclomycin/chloramphenicol resistance-like MFS transporter
MLRLPVVVAHLSQFNNMVNKMQLPLYWLIIITLLGCEMELDISVPSFPEMMRYFAVSESMIQYTISANFLGFCLASLVYGPVSEATGRRIWMLIGSSLFLIGALGCVFSPSIEWLILARFIQGVGASSALVLGFTMIVDYYRSDQVTNYIGKINAISTLFLAFAPIVGGLLNKYFSWRANFIFIAALAALSWVLIVKMLPETLQHKKTITFKNVFNDYLRLIKSKNFMIYSLVPNLLVAGYLTYLGSTAFYYIKSCEISVIEFAIHQGIVVAGFSVMSFYTGKITNKLGANNAAILGAILCVLGSLLLLLAAYYLPFQAYLVTITMCLVAIGAAFTMSVTFAQSLEFFPDLKGIASSFIQASRLLISALTVAFAGEIYDGTMLPVASILSICNITALILTFVIYKTEWKQLLRIKA